MQAVRRDQVSLATSCSLMKMMLLAGFGSIAKNRELFPEENFADKRLQGGEFPDSAKFLPGSQGSQSGRSVASGMRVTLVKRDYTPEANQLLDYLEKGIFDALERRFLRSFIFAIYLDKENPNDIIEAYTFSFSYRKVAGSDQIVPVLSLGQQLDNLSLGQAVCIDPTPGQSAGNPPTLGQAKQSIKALLTCLTNNVKNFDALPTRRYATFKMYYTDNTPDDYEPPFFHKGDAEADKFTFNTHTSLEQPETLDVGSADTGHHTVQVHMASITSFLPSRDANDAALLGFVGHDNAQHPSALTPMQIDEIRAQQAAAQIDDAQKRVVPWDAEDTTSLSIQRSVSDQDADGEPDPEFASANDSVGDHSLRMDLDETPNEAVPVIAGALEHVPAHVAKLSDGHGISETQSTQILLENSHRLPDSMRSTEPSHGLDTMELRDMITSKAAARKVIHPQEGKDEIAGKMSHLMSIDDENEHAIDCSCEVQDEDDGLCQCEGPCHRWFHIWCMGYHDITDPRMPDHFICLKCRVESDEKFPLIKGTSRYGNILENFKELALLRRSIKYVERECPDSLTQFKRLIGCELSVAAQFWKRLETEGFITCTTRSSAAVEDLDRPNTDASRKKIKLRSKKISSRPRYRKVPSAFQDAKYQNYFSPTSAAENTIIGLVWMPRALHTVNSRKPSIQDDKCTQQTPSARIDTSLPSRSNLQESQTQLESQPVITQETERSSLKRKDSHLGGTRKKIKVSLADAVDLEA